MRAFTLIEMLATVVLLAMIASAGAIGLSGASDTARWQEAAAIIRATDTDARSLARTGGVVTVTLNEDRDTLRLHAGDELVLERQSPVTLHLVDPSSDTPLDELVFDPSGRSPDYLVVLDDGTRREQIHISGLTGWASR